MTFSGTDEPGVYQITVRRGRAEPVIARGLSFVVVTDPRESDTTRIDPAELAAHLRGTVAGDNGALLAGAGSGASRPMWSALLFLAVMAFVAESWLCNPAGAGGKKLPVAHRR